MAGPPYIHIKFVISGDILTTQSWSIGFDFSLASVPDGTQLAAWLATLEPFVTTWWNTTNGPKAFNSTSLRLTTLKAYAYAAGATSATSQATRVLATPLVGTSSGVMPTQACLVLTKVSAFVGRKNRGRAYLPATGATLTTHKANSTFITAIATATATMLTAINGTTLNGTGPIAIIASMQSVPPAIRNIRVDDEIDIQRRRADKILAGTTVLSPTI